MITSSGVPLNLKILATNPNTSEDVLRGLAKNEYSYIRYTVAGHINTPADSLVHLGKDTYWEVRIHVAQHPNTPLTVLKELTHDEDDGVRQFIIRNPNITPALLIMILEYENTFKLPNTVTIKELYNHPKLPLVGKSIIETVYRHRIQYLKDI